VDTQKLPNFAAAALSQGTDCQALRELAGLSSVDVTEAGKLLERAVHELGLTVPDKPTAALRYAICVSRLILSNEVAPYEAAMALWDASLAVGDSSFHELDAFIYAASEYVDRPSDRALFDSAIVAAAQRWAATDQER
jgi:hypothetical protein